MCDSKDNLWAFGVGPGQFGLFITIPSVPTPPPLGPLRLQLLLDFRVLKFFPEWFLKFCVRTIRQEIWPSPGTLVSCSFRAHVSSLQQIWEPWVIANTDKPIYTYTYEYKYRLSLPFPNVPIVPKPESDWCCFYYFTTNSLLALLEARFSFFLSFFARD